MIKDRLIFALIFADGFFHQSRNFRLQRVGDINWLLNNYNFVNISNAIDELILIDASREYKLTPEFFNVLSKLRSKLFLPITVGGGIRNLLNAKDLFNKGADKVLVNYSLYNDKNLIINLSKNYGSQALIASIDFKRIGGSIIYFSNSGKEQVCDELDYSLLNEYCGEIFLTSIDQDGTGFGIDIESSLIFSKKINLPLILSGGVGNYKHIIAGLGIDHCNAVCTANLFNFMGDELLNTRVKLYEAGLNLTKWRVK